jgi:hypothetical protein
MFRRKAYRREDSRWLSGWPQQSWRKKKISGIDYGRGATFPAPPLDSPEFRDFLLDLALDLEARAKRSEDGD